MGKYERRIENSALGTVLTVSGNDQTAVEEKAAELQDRWAREQDAATIMVTLSRSPTPYSSAKAVLANALTLERLLYWSVALNNTPFPALAPKKPVRPLPARPSQSDPQFQPTWVDKLLSRDWRSKEELKQAEQVWENEESIWNLYAQWEEQKKEWDAALGRFNQAIKSMAKIVDTARGAYDGGDNSEGVVAPFIQGTINFAETALGSGSPWNWITDNECAFRSETGTLIVECNLPAPSDVPTLGDEVLAARGIAVSVPGKPLKPAESRALYDNVLYQLCFRVIHLSYFFDTRNIIKSVVFNGWVKFIDPATGHEKHVCIMSVGAEREAFLSINLARIDPKICFRSFKGISAAQLNGLVPIAPLMSISREDSRFIEGTKIVDRVDKGTNLAAMGWEDFEHLIREIFEKEFSTSGGEVKVTQASRDGGVDAVAFDPDPIRGGKIIIQAKRYTNTVEVSAVRDLYGTVQHEGAIKGILVTTSQFGPDAYDFAKDKPLALLDGSNLLHLLERHGHRAHIDLREAKQLNVALLRRSAERPASDLF